MKHVYLLLSMVFLSSTVMLAQQDYHPENFCANQQGRSKWLKQYQLHPDTYEKGGGIIYVAMTIHILGTDEGVGYYSENNLLHAFCLLNESFAPAGIQFVMNGPVLYHNNSSYYQHETVLEGGEMMFEYNVPNSLNTYFVSDPAGNCGYNLPYAGIANSIGCSGPNDITWSHEVGHALSLPHPFLGWEGGVSWDGSVDHNFSDPAPERVTYDYTFFQDTLILDTLIIDTAFVERVDGSNCTIAADGFCDTAPDYLASRWTCNGDGISSAVQHDPVDESFQSDGSLIMNYADDDCQNRFSPEQQDAMRAFLIDQREDWIIVPVGEEAIVDSPVLLAPIAGETQSVFAGELSWEAVAGATNYLVQISRLSSFPPALTDNYLTASTSLITDELDDQRTYYWRVRPYNSIYTCSPFSAAENFMVEHPTTTIDIEALTAWHAYPQPLKNGETMQIKVQMTESWSGQMTLVNQLGQQLWHKAIEWGPGEHTISAPTQSLAAGLYYLNLHSGRESNVLKVIIQ